MTDGELAAGELRVDVQRPSNELCIVSLEGELDLSNAPQFVQSLAGAVGSGRTVVELSRLTFMDSTGVKELLGLSRAAKAAGGSIVVAVPHPNLARLFEIIDLGERIPIVPSLEAATSESA